VNIRIGAAELRHQALAGGSVEVDGSAPPAARRAAAEQVAGGVISVP
jgi:8-oxo-dGTP pyrophosphatase MutT (NUDIX family)